jgi:hypothetical protein
MGLRAGIAGAKRLAAVMAIALLVVLFRGGAVAVADDSGTLLVVDGKTAGGKSAAFDLAALKTLPSITVTTTTPWTDGENEFAGVRLRDLLQHAGAAAADVMAAGVDDYQAIVPAEDLENNDVIVAYAMNGKPMPADNKGPLWLIYPFSAHPTLQKDLYYARSVWQLNRLTVQ